MAAARYAAAFAAALILGLAVGVPVATLGLVVPGLWILPVTFGVAGAFSALGAAWVANLVVRDGGRARLGLVLVGTETTALVVLAIFVGTALLGIGDGLPLFTRLVASMVPVAINAAILSVRAREGQTRYAQDVLFSLAVAGAAVLAPVVLIVAVCPLIGCTG